jgi:hypothetical protein
VIITALRVEWAKARARADRWEEDMALLDEEMCHVLVFCGWKVLWWAEQPPHREGLPAPLAEGLQAYAAEQADMERHISLSWTAKWAVAHELARPIVWAVFGEEPTTPARQPRGSTDIIELDLNEEDDNADNSDFEK